ncbi:MAG: hypothetical protein ABIJ45_09535 [Candidatus Zixiibacteriota bacterium]
MVNFSDKYKFVSCAENRGKIDEIDQKSHLIWPEFMLHDPVPKKYWNRLYSDFSKYQFAIIDKTAETAIGQVNAVPFHWDDFIGNLPEEGWDWVFEKAVKDCDTGISPNMISLLQIAILPEYHGDGISPRAISTIKTVAGESKFKNLVAPVRPNLKHLYPLADIDDYIKWKNNDGFPFDPWLRTHLRSGARIVKPCRRAMTISGTVEEWESWTKLKFPQSGEYVVPYALNPISVNLAKKSAIYIEPNVWVAYDLSSS